MSTDREEIRGKRKGSWQGQLQAPEASAGRERNRLTAMTGGAGIWALPY